MIQLHVYIMLTVEVRYDVQVLASVLRESRVGVVQGRFPQITENYLNALVTWMLY